jgi:pimeloyl-ACP methyl ester carboxylesterase
MRHNLLAHMLHHPHSVDAAALYLHTQACLRTRFRSKSLSRAGGLQSLLPRAADALLLAWGEHDVTAEPSEVAGYLSACHPRAHAAVLPGAGHWVQNEVPEAVNCLLRGWLDHQSPCEKDVDHARD